MAEFEMSCAGITQIGASNQPLPVGAVALAVPAQAIGTVALAWASFGLVVKASTAVGEGIDGVLHTRADDCVSGMLEVLFSSGTFLGLTYVRGLLSAFLVEASAVGAGALAGTIGGVTGPALITVVLHAEIDWRIWGESVAVGAASGVAVTVLNRLTTAAAVIAAVRTRITALRG